MAARPFVKWAGGKRQIVDKLFDIVSSQEMNNYFEPFLGGGALFFELEASNELPNKAILTDNNDELINAYLVIKQDFTNLIEALKNREEEHKRETGVNAERYYYKVRGLETRKTRELGLEESELEEVESLDCVDRAARFIYLNRTCYNGLYRVNSDGQFNVPYGRYENPRILDSDNLDKVQRVLRQRKVSVYKADFQDIETGVGSGDNRISVGENDLVYFDPPYHLPETNGFTSYTGEGFDEEDQRNLFELAARLATESVKANIIISNSNDSFILEQCKEFGFYTYSVEALRAINCNGRDRTGVTELIITSFVVPENIVNKHSLSRVKL